MHACYVIDRGSTKVVCAKDTRAEAVRAAGRLFLVAVIEGYEHWVGVVKWWCVSDCGVFRMFVIVNVISS